MQTAHLRGKKPESTLFEDSPTGYSNQHLSSQQRALFNKELERDYLEKEVYDPPSSHQSEGAESENDIENIIMNLYNKMKGLENKYIDLANFYKQELVKAGDSDSPAQQKQESNPLSEGEIIRELIEEKKRLQEEMRLAIQTHN